MDEAPWTAAYGVDNQEDLTRATAGRSVELKQDRAKVFAKRRWAGFLPETHSRDSGLQKPRLALINGKAKSNYMADRWKSNCGFAPIYLRERMQAAVVAG